MILSSAGRYLHFPGDSTVVPAFDHPQHEDFSLLLGQLLDAPPGFGDGLLVFEGRVADGSGCLRNVFDGRRFASLLPPQVCQRVVGCNYRKPPPDAGSLEAFAEKLLMQSDEGVLDNVACGVPAAGDVVGEAQEPSLLKLYVAAELGLPVPGFGFLLRCGEQGLFEHFLKRVRGLMVAGFRLSLFLCHR